MNDKKRSTNQSGLPTDSALGDPQKEIKFIRVAGSNGKGSTCAMLESTLKAAGYRTDIRSVCSMLLKKRQRLDCLSARRALTKEQRKVYSGKICSFLKELPEIQKARTVFSYMAAAEEADMSDFNEWAVSQGKRLAFPISYAGGRMEAVIPNGPESWETGKYGITAPVRELSVPVKPEEIDVVIVPCVGFDGAGGRIGHGGGYYDRYLPLCPQAKYILAAFEAQRVDSAVQETTDFPVSAAVTENGVLYF